MFATLAVLAALCFAIGGYFTKLSLGLTALEKSGPPAFPFSVDHVAQDNFVHASVY